MKNSFSAQIVTEIPFNGSYLVSEILRENGEG